MKAFVVTEPLAYEVRDVAPPTADLGSVVVDVERVGVCGTDVDFFRGDMAYLQDGHAHFPMRLGHEWMGTVSAVGEGVASKWLGRRVTGDTMLGCGECRRCRAGHQHVCELRREVGIRGDFPGALAEQIAVPVTSLHALPDTIDDAAGALVEPGGSALRALLAADLDPGDRLLVLGPGTIGLLVALFAQARDIEVHVVGIDTATIDFARTLGLDGVWHDSHTPDLAWDAVVNASTDAASPAKALDLVEPSGRVVYVGLGSGTAAIDSNTLTLKDVTAVGILSASPALAETISLYASGAVDPRPLIGATIALEGVGDVLSGRRPPSAGPGPKIHVDPRT
jgi:threonine dehydrogenase-like Zn-dependent dehydrogenase